MRVVIFGLLLLFAAGCASSQSNDVPSDITEATGDVAATDKGAPPPPTDGTSAPSGETSEQDLQNNPMADNQVPPTPGAEVPPPAPVPAPESPSKSAQAETPPPPPETEPTIPQATGAPATLTGLDFKGNVNGGTIVIRTDKPIQFTTRRNDSANQFIVDLRNTAVPSKYRRPYTTKEFPGPIASINAYQSKGAREGHIVIQLRENVEPAVVQDGNIISVAGAGSPIKNSQVAGNTLPPPEETKSEESAAPSTAEATTKVDEEEEESMTISGQSDKAILSNHSLADFLTGNTKFVGRPISLEVKDSDVRDIFRFISEETGLNMVVGEDVQGKITLKLRKIPWDQALSIILQSKQLGYVKQGNILRIATLATLQKESDAAKSVVDAQRQLQPLHVQVFPISYAKATDMESQSKDFLSPRGKSRADSRTNNLVVTDIDENLSRIRQLVRRLDTQTPQVLIEAKVVEARESFERIVGVNWGFSGDILPVGQNSNSGASVAFQPNLTSGSAANATPYLSTGFSISNMDIFGNLSATLQLLETENLVKVISAPRIVTLDRVQATIEQTTQFPIFAAQATTATVPGTTPTTSVTFQDVKLSLDVTPQITKDGSIIITLKVLREFPDAQVSVGGSTARPINKRSASTQVLVENGDTVVIGGIYQSDVSEGESGVPWLRSIPLIGALFRNRTTTKEKNELVIFLTPRILNREKAFLKPEGAG